MKIQRYCDFCGAPFTTTYPHKVFCQGTCRVAFNKIVTDNAAVALRAVRDSVRAIVRARQARERGHDSDFTQGEQP